VDAASVGAAPPPSEIEMKGQTTDQESPGVELASGTNLGDLVLLPPNLPLATTNVESGNGNESPPSVSEEAWEIVNHDQAASQTSTIGTGLVPLAHGGSTAPLEAHNAAVEPTLEEQQAVLLSNNQAVPNNQLVGFGTPTDGDVAVAESVTAPTDGSLPTDTSVPAPAPTDGSVPSDASIPAPAPTDASVPAPAADGGSVPTDGLEPVPAPTDGSVPVPAPTDGSEPVPAPTDGGAPTDGSVPAPTDGFVPAPSDGSEPVPAPTDGSVPVPAPTDGADGSVPAPTPTDGGSVPAPAPTDGSEPADGSVPAPVPTNGSEPAPAPTDASVPTDGSEPAPVPTDSGSVPAPVPTDGSVPGPAPTVAPPTATGGGGFVPTVPGIPPPPTAAGGGYNTPPVTQPAPTNPIPLPTVITPSNPGGVEPPTSPGGSIINPYGPPTTQHSAPSDIPWGHEFPGSGDQLGAGGNMKPHNDVTPTTTPKNPNATKTCNFLCQTQTSMRQHPLSWLVTLVAAYGLLMIRRQRRQRAQQEATRGEYRQVEARFADNAFGDDYNPDENAEYLSEDEEGWVNNGSIQMRTFGKDGLSLDEMNG